ADEDELGQAVRRIVSDPSFAAQLAAAARKRVDEAYSFERISAQLGRRLLRSSPQTRHMPFFSVVVATYERHAHLSRLMERLRQQRCKDFEVIVVDQSREQWRDVEAHADLNVCYVHTDVKGAVKARNIGAFQALGQVLVFTDDDTEPYPDWLENARPYFDDR